MEGENEIGPFGIEVAEDIDDYPWFWRFRSKGEINLDISGQECCGYHAKRKLLREIMDYIDWVEENGSYQYAISGYLTSVLSAFSNLSRNNHNQQIETIHINNKIEMNLGNIHAIRHEEQQCKAWANRISKEP